MRSASPAAWPAGIIEYLAEGTWTKRMHAGWAAQSGLRAALLARAGFRRAAHGVRGRAWPVPRLRAYDRTATTARSIGDFGERWVTETLAFKPYPCGTMTHPYIDCARRLAARGITPEDINEIVCEVAEGTVHRLWEPLADKQRPPNGYAAKFSTPYCIAAGFVRGGVGLDAFTDAAVRDPARARARRQGALPRSIRTIPIPTNYTGHIRARAARRPTSSKSASRICAAARTSR